MSTADGPGRSADVPMLVWLAIVAVLVTSELATDAPRVRAGLTLAISVGAAIAAVVGVRRHRPPVVAPWLVVGAAMAAFAVGNVVWLVTGDASGSTPTGQMAINAAKLVAFGLLLVAAVLSVMAASWSRDAGPRVPRAARGLRERLVDVCLIGSAVALMVAQWATAGADTPALVGAPGFGEAAVALGVVGVLVVVMTTLPAAGRSALSGRLLIAALALGGIGNATVTVAGDDAPRLLAITPLLTATGLVGAAALHPSMVRLSGGAAPRAEDDPWQVAAGAREVDLGAAVRVRTTLMIVLTAMVLVLPVVDLLIAGPDGPPSARTLTISVVSVLVLSRIAALSSARDRMAAQLMQSSRRFQALVAHHAEAIVVVGHDGLVRYASPATGVVLGRAAGEADRVALAELAPPPPRAGVSSVADVLARLPAGSGTPITHRCQVQRPDGDVRDVEVTAVDLREVEVVRGAVLHLRDVTSRVELEDRLRAQALTDALTGLPNRVLLADRADQELRRARRERRRVGALVIDLDGFKHVNDSLGHGAGDDVLVSAARRMTACLRPGDTCARLGGDEFAVLLDGDVSETDALVVGRRIVDTMREPFTVADHRVHVAASVGIAVTPPVDVSTRAASVLRDADLAMYAAKHAGGGRVSVFEPHMRTTADARIDVRSTLSAAIEAGEIEVHYQPIVRLDDLSVVGVEALARWRRAGRLRTPETFIGVAEERDDLIGPLGEAVLGQACAAVAAAGDPLDLHVNVSPRQLRAEGFHATVERAAAETGLVLGRLVLELTESSAIDGVGAARTLTRLRAMGVRIAIDDFGTGYSNLQRLRQMPVDVLKIDRSLVADLADEQRCATAARVVEAVRSVADSMDAVTHAEGVEHDVQRALLLDLGCSVGQGWLFGRPERVPTWPRLPVGR